MNGLQAQFEPRAGGLFFRELAGREFTPRRYRPGVIATWSGHLPFAYDLIGALRPSLLVELGTHYGESYFGFCQAIEEHGLATRCYAVDTWRGDPQAGFYDEAVYEEVNSYNRAHYARFSSLLRMAFDEAVGQFSNATIDLLHIDGLHNYEAVSHDFFGWLPKVKPGGVVLLHDVMSRTPGFEVWRLWEELSQRFPAFAFHHSWGLGVLRIPGKQEWDDPLEWLLRSNAAEQEQVRRHYCLLAENLEYRWVIGRARAYSRDLVRIKVYAFGVSGYGESHSVSMDVPPQQWQRTTFRLTHGAGRGPIRIDPADMPAIVDIAEIRVSRADEGQVIWEATEESGFDSVRVNDQVRVLSTKGHFRCACYGFDSQILLPEIPGLVTEDPLSIEIWLSVDTDMRALTPDHLASDNATLRSEIMRLSREHTSSEEHARLLQNAVAALTDERTTLEQSAAKLQMELGETRNQICATEAKFRELAVQREMLDRELAVQREMLDRELLESRQRQAEQQRQLHDGEVQLRALAAERDRLNQRVVELSDAVHADQKRIRDLLESWSWRLTFPLRWVGRFGGR